MSRNPKDAKKDAVMDDACLCLFVYRHVIAIANFDCLSNSKCAFLLFFSSQQTQ